MKKYESTGENIVIGDKTLYRIQSVRNFSNVKKGELGGFIESEINLSHDGDAWVYGNAEVYGDARVCGDARVYGNAQVYGNTRVYGNAQVYGDARVCGDAQVYGNAQVYGDARVYGNADYTVIKGFGTEHRTTTFFKRLDGKIGVVCGCFRGTLDEFREQVKETRRGKIAKEYLMIADLMEYHFSEEEE